MINSAFSKNIDNQLLINQLEEHLNERKDNLLKELFLQKSFNQFNKQYLAFQTKHKNYSLIVRGYRETIALASCPLMT